MASWVLTNWWSVMWKKDLIMNFVMMLQHHVVSNHQQLVCLLNSLFRLTAPSNHHLCITGPLWEECQHWLVVSLHKSQLCKNFPVSSHQHLIQGFSQEGPVMMKVFLCHAIILFHHFFFLFFQACNPKFNNLDHLTRIWESLEQANYGSISIKENYKISARISAKADFDITWS